MGSNLNFGSRLFDPGSSSLSVTMIAAYNRAGIGVLGHADSVEWTDATILNGVKYPDGLIYVNEDDNIGELWQINPDGSNPIRVARTNLDDESTGVLDLSELVGYKPSRILICNNLGFAKNFGSPSSMTLCFLARLYRQVMVSALQMEKVHPVHDLPLAVQVWGHVLGAKQATEFARQESTARTIHAMLISDPLASHSVVTRVLLHGMRVASYPLPVVVT